MHSSLLTITLLFFAQAASFDSALRAGLIALNGNDLKQAQQQLETAATLQPASPQVWLALAQTYWKLKDSSAAQSAARKAEELSGPDAGILHGLAFFYGENGNYAKAAELEAAYAIKASDADAALRAADLYMRTGDSKGAIEVARKGLTIENRADLHSLLAKAYALQKDPGHVKAELTEAMNLDRHDESYRFELAQLLLQQEDFEAAVRVLQEGKQLFLTSAQLELALGVAYYGLRRFPEAIDSFLRTISLAPDVDQPYYFLGRMLDVAEVKRAVVVDALRVFSEQKPQSYLSACLYGKALAGEPDGQKPAEALLRKSILLRDDYPESHLELGILLERTGRLPEAAAELKRSAALSPRDPVPHYRLARVYDRLGNKGEAEAERKMHQQLTAGQKKMAAPLDLPVVIK